MSSAPAATDSRTASPSRSFRSRMGTVIRRTSTGLSSIPRPNALRRPTSKGSLKIDPTSVTPPDTTMFPSPVAESPAREAAAENSPIPAPPVGPSPLAASVLPTDSTSAEPALSTERPVVVPQSSSAEPEPEPTPETANPVAEVPAAQSEVSTPSIAPEPTIPPAKEATAPIVSSPESVQSPLPSQVERQPTVSSVPSAPSAPAVEKRGQDYITAGEEQILAPNWSGSVLKNQDTVVDTVSVSQVSVEAPTETRDVRPTDAEAFAWKDDQLTLSPKQSMSSLISRVTRDASLPPRSGRVSKKASRSSMASSYGQVLVSTTGKQVSISTDDNEEDTRRGRSPGPTVRILAEDPFADPPKQPAPVIKKSDLSPIESVVDAPIADKPKQDSAWLVPVSMPLPPQREVIASSTRTIPEAPGYNFEDSSSVINGTITQPEADERTPLLRALASANGNPTVGSSSLLVPFPTSEISLGPRSVEISGWVEHTLPDSSFYYSNADLHVVTDVDLRDSRKLNLVMKYLQGKSSDNVNSIPSGWELWLQDISSGIKDSVKPVRRWVNHKARVVSPDPPSAESGTTNLADDDKLDMEYRYWSFLEGHPAHIPLSPQARAEAIDALTWSYTDCLLPESREVPPPFSQQECQELVALLRSTDNSSGNLSLVQTRIVARVLTRVARWKQYHFRPHKALPQDISKGGRRTTRRVPIHRRVADVLFACLCLGIPYFFVDRANQQRLDEESGIRSAGPMLMISACACLVAAVILSASVTLISLPGLDDIPRLAGLLAILFSALSMVSAVVALFRYRTDTGRTVVYVGGEGLMLLTRRSIVMSLPLVFLAWAIVTFVTGVTIYSIHGATSPNRHILRDFEDTTRWVVLGTVGGMAGMMTLAAVLR